MPFSVEPESGGATIRWRGVPRLADAPAVIAELRAQCNDAPLTWAVHDTSGATPPSLRVLEGEFERLHLLARGVRELGLDSVHRIAVVAIDPRFRELATDIQRFAGRMGSRHRFEVFDGEVDARAWALTSHPDPAEDKP